jgi:hypothetical protein
VYPVTERDHSGGVIDDEYPCVRTRTAETVDLSPPVRDRRTGAEYVAARVVVHL